MNDIQQKNIETVKFALSNALDGNMAVLGAVIAEDFVIYEAEGLPFGGVFHGIQGYVDCMRGLDGFWSDRALPESEFVPAGDDKVVILSTFDGHMAHNGQHVQMPTITRWDLRGGKIATVRVFFFDSNKIADLAAL